MASSSPIQFPSSHHSRESDSSSDEDMEIDSLQPSSQTARKRPPPVCRKCKPAVTFETAGGKVSHLSRVHKIEYKCTQCTQFFGSPKSLRDHQRNKNWCESRRARDSPENRRCPYPDCKEKPLFRDKKTRDQHVSRVHDRTKDAICPGCGVSYGTQYYIDHSHTCDPPKDQKHVTCDHCHLTWVGKWRAQPSNHGCKAVKDLTASLPTEEEAGKLTAGQNKVEHRCLKCGKVFTRLYGLSTHQKNEDGCGAKKNARLTVKRHEERESVENRLCTIPGCKFKDPFPTSNAKIKHISRHHPEWRFTSQRSRPCQSYSSGGHESQDPSINGKERMPSQPLKAQPQNVPGDTGDTSELNHDDWNTEWALNELLTANEEDEIIQDLFPL